MILSLNQYITANQKKLDGTMKVPQMPPKLTEYIATLDAKERNSYIMNFSMKRAKVVDDKGRYAHWDKLQYRPLPENVDSHLEYWHLIKVARKIVAKETIFQDKENYPFSYVEFDKLNQLKDWVLENATGSINAPTQVKEKSTKNTFLIKSVIEESISSSQMEGASTTRRIAKEMLRTGRDPKDLSETMIVNNYRAMNFIRQILKDDDDIELTPAIIFELHKIVTDDTLTGEDEGKGGILRTNEDMIAVHDPKSNDILHMPPKAENLPERLQLLCDFANGKTDKDNTYMPPVIRAIITHFMMGYDHFFVEGNGRTARALFYWIMIKNNYWLMEYVSISSVIKKRQTEYLLAYLHTESDENDLTYFILQQLEVIKDAIKEFHDHVKKQAEKDQDILAMFKASPIRESLNSRQIALIRNALKNPGNAYTVNSHKNSHACSNEASRKDLLALSDEFNLLVKSRAGASWLFLAPNDIGERIKIASEK